ncbi:hypothetical protein [Corynebacterium macginleyi]|uniref:hypothetical protein n=1 Tax=Corynebacterium macginleyi TaxID=38290 RepID=UPI001605088A|nr:hypothetical protein [Corynebacterium macginleyi]
MMVDYLSSQLDWAGYQVSTKWGSGPGFGPPITTRGDKSTIPVIFPRLADELDRETIPVFIDEPDHFLTLLAWFRREKADAAFNNSLVSRSS